MTIINVCLKSKIVTTTILVWRGYFNKTSHADGNTQGCCNRNMETLHGFLLFLSLSKEINLSDRDENF